MRLGFWAVIALMSAALVQGCMSSGDDPANIDKAPPAKDTSHALAPNTTKKLPTMGGPSTMGGAPGGAPAASGLSSKPAEKPAGAGGQ
ncbi:MAG TPA: hypothetical protein VG944_17185 [Fimbriimonas sp.]|nr:hypothetical protein [Fimbriimonas sp.]